MPSTLDALVSYAYFKNKDLGLIRDSIGPDALLVIDSGAFTVKSSGKVITVEEYADYLKKWEGVYDFAFTLDVIGDPEATRENLARLVKLKVKNLVPIHTAAAPLTDFDELCKEWPLVGSGGMRSSTAITSLGQSMNHGLAARAATHGTAVHFLGFITPGLMTAARPYSGDSSSPSQALSYGKCYCWNGNGFSNGFHYDRRYVERNREMLQACGLSLRLLLSGRGQEGPENMAAIARTGVWSIALGALHVQRSVQSLVNPPGLPTGPRLICAWNPGFWKAYAEAAKAWVTHTCPPGLERMRAKYGDVPDRKVPA